MTEPLRARIVVGVDGSPDSVRALQLAARVAPAFDASIELVSVWEPPIEFGWTYPVALRTYDWKTETRRLAENALDAAFGDTRPRDVTISVIEGYPATALVRASKGAALLIVGSRGHGQFASLLLGSVGVKCVEHAHCPVLVARSDSSEVSQARTEADVKHGALAGG